jgi:hypothetical protein
VGEADHGDGDGNGEDAGQQWVTTSHSKLLIGPAI